MNATATQTTAQLIIQAYNAQGAEWVSLETIRTTLHWISRAEMDQALLEVALTPRIHVDPVANLKSLTRDQRDAAIIIGGEACHAIMIEGGW